MKIGFIGLGKLGFPVAIAIAHKGFDVVGFDPKIAAMPQGNLALEGGYKNQSFEEIVAATTLRLGTRQEVCEHADILFVAVQTPHEPRFEGRTILPPTDDRADFYYGNLKEATRQIDLHIKKPTTVAVISTMLPGTSRRELFPIFANNPDFHFVYNPSFIAMGTTIEDFLYPEFVLIGGDDDDASHQIRRMARFYSDLMPKVRMHVMSVESAELTKVAYNTFIGAKIAVANTIMEICDAIPQADVDDVTGALKKANRRITGPNYMSGGMGDGGGCHPRDNIAMSWLAQKLGISHNIFEDIMRCREDQARYLAALILDHARGRSATILGYAYKPGTDLIAGSPAMLVADILHRHSDFDYTMIDPVVAHRSIPYLSDTIVLIGCKHKEFAEVPFGNNVTVIDPFRYIPDQDGVEIIRIGEQGRARPVVHNVVVTDTIGMLDKGP